MRGTKAEEEEEEVEVNENNKLRGGRIEFGCKLYNSTRGHICNDHPGRGGHPSPVSRSS